MIDCDVAGRMHQYVTFDSCLFDNNVALMGGAAMFMSNVNSMVIQTSIFRANHAYYDGVGGILMSTCDDVIIDQCIFDSNIGEMSTCGGCIYMLDMNDVVLSNLVFVGNIAMGTYGKGGAICLMNSKRTDMTNVTLTRNHASLDGGALFIQESRLSRVDNSTFHGNTVLYGSGSAIHIREGEECTILYNHFQANEAMEGGGTVFWDSNEEPIALRAGSNTFADDNVAAYGSFWATRAKHLRVEITEYNITEFETVLPSITVDVLDFYSQIVVIENLRFAQAFALSTSDCAGNIGHIGGEKSIRFIQGTANFSQLEALCAPGHTLDMQIMSNHFVDAVDLFVTFRSCERGEYLSAQICQACENGYYSFIEPEDMSSSFELSQANVCQECPSSGVDECYKDQIVLEKGFWRISPFSADIFECPLHEEACIGM